MFVCGGFVASLLFLLFVLFVCLVLFVVCIAGIAGSLAGWLACLLLLPHNTIRCRWTHGPAPNLNANSTADKWKSAPKPRPKRKSRLTSELRLSPQSKDKRRTWPSKVANGDKTLHKPRKNSWVDTKKRYSSPELCLLGCLLAALLAVLACWLACLLLLLPRNESQFRCGWRHGPEWNPNAESTRMEERTQTLTQTQMQTDTRTQTPSPIQSQSQT